MFQSKAQSSKFWALRFHVESSFVAATVQWWTTRATQSCNCFAQGRGYEENQRGVGRQTWSYVRHERILNCSINSFDSYIKIHDCCSMIFSIENSTFQFWYSQGYWKAHIQNIFLPDAIWLIFSLPAGIGRADVTNYFVWALYLQCSIV